MINGSFGEVLDISGYKVSFIITFFKNDFVERNICSVRMSYPEGEGFNRYIFIFYLSFDGI